MGSSSSKSLVTDPARFATKLPQSAFVAPPTWREYDYVIVGGGTAGCVLAARLSENEKRTVLLLEAGLRQDSNASTRVPFGFTKVFKTKADWDYHTTPQDALNDREIYLPHGKIMGGSSSMNGSVYHQCSPGDFDQWERDGAHGWSYEDLKPYFRKAEQYHPSPLFPGVNNEDRGFNGPWSTSHCAESAPANDYIIEAFKAMGVSYNADVNTAKGTMGVTHFIGTVDGKGHRSSTATAYLTPAVLARRNLTIAVGVRVSKIVVEPNTDGLRAVGVQMSTAPMHQLYRVDARHEILLCCGAIGSPQLLMLSGIGAADELRSLGITLVQDLPSVGKHLADHVKSGPLIFRAKPAVTWDHLHKSLPRTTAVTRWAATGTGPLSTLQTPAGVFLRSGDRRFPFRPKDPQDRDDPVEDMTSGPGSPDLEVLWSSMLLLDHGFKAPPPGASGITMNAVVLKPKSTGFVRLKEPTVWDPPFVDPNYFDAESDMNVCVRGIRLLMNLARSEPLRSLLDLPPHSTNADSIFWPGDAHPDKVSNDELRSWIRHNAESSCHLTGSARIGMNPGDSVVDSDLRVHGMMGLRVVDASVFPSQVSGHPCAVVVAIAEKIADSIMKQQ